MEAISALARAVRICGSQSELARRIRVKQQNVWSWLNKSKRVPAEACKAIEDATGGQVTCHELRPDVFGEPAGSGCVSDASPGEAPRGAAGTGAGHPTAPRPSRVVHWGRS
jgi:DNA-binding transcriptional regulator YdaS (Cro superfamily)